MKITRSKLKEMIQEELESIKEGMSKREGAEVIAQLGGGRFIAMTGAKDFFIGPKGMVFKIGRNSKSVNYIRINLNSMDTYDVEFLSIRNYKEKVKYSKKKCIKWTLPIESVKTNYYWRAFNLIG